MTARSFGFIFFAPLFCLLAWTCLASCLPTCLPNYLPTCLTAPHTMDANLLATSSSTTPFEIQHIRFVAHDSAGGMGASLLFENTPMPASLESNGLNLSSLFDFDAMLSKFADLLKRSFKKIRDDALYIAQGETIQTLAQLLAFSFATFALVFPALRYSATGSSSDLWELLHTMLGVGFFASFLIFQNYERIIETLIRTFESLATGILGEQNFLSILLQNFSEMSKNVLNSFPSLSDVLELSLGYLVVLILSGVIALVCGVMSIFYIVIYLNLGNVLLAIGIALGPLFFACGVWQVTRPYFDKWLGFMLHATFYQVVASVLISLLAHSALIQPIKSGVEATIYLLFALINMSIIAFICRMLPDIVNALLPVGIGQMSSVGHASGQVAAKMISVQKLIGFLRMVVTRKP